MPRNGGRPVTSAELDAHLTPIREDIRRLVTDQREFAEFMTGAITSRSIQQGVMKSRHFWLGTALSFGTMLAGAVLLLVSHHG